MTAAIAAAAATAADGEAEKKHSTAQQLRAPTILVSPSVGESLEPPPRYWYPTLRAAAGWWFSMSHCLVTNSLEALGTYRQVENQGSVSRSTGSACGDPGVEDDKEGLD
ncbi:hypothetical protein AB5N19_13722 [Seiridium cardinale]